jgi:hypothetical protein
MSVRQRADANPILQLHLEPNEPIEVSELTGALGSLARQYQTFVGKDRVLGRGSDARLLVSSVSPGSIDIAFVPDLQAVAGVLVAAYDPLKHLLDFAEQVRRLMKFFAGGSEKAEGAAEQGITLKDCDDAISLAAPISNHGGTQTITVIKGDLIIPVLSVSVDEAREIADRAQRTRAVLADTQSEVRQRVPLIWKRLDRAKGRTESRGSPDRALIPEIDKADRPVFFTDETAYLKDEMLGEEENPWMRVYFVDVEISRIEGKVVSYRVVGYHGKEDLD